MSSDRGFDDSHQGRLVRLLGQIAVRLLAARNCFHDDNHAILGILDYCRIHIVAYHSCHRCGNRKRHSDDGILLDTPYCHDAKSRYPLLRLSFARLQQAWSIVDKLVLDE